MNINDIINKYYNILVICSVFFIIVSMGIFFFFLFRYIGHKNAIERKKFKEDMHIIRINELNDREEYIEFS